MSVVRLYHDIGRPEYPFDVPDAFSRLLVLSVVPYINLIKLLYEISFNWIGIAALSAPDLPRILHLEND